MILVRLAIPHPSLFVRFRQPKKKHAKKKMRQHLLLLVLLCIVLFCKAQKGSWTPPKQHKYTSSDGFTIAFDALQDRYSLLYKSDGTKFAYSVARDLRGYNTIQQGDGKCINDAQASKLLIFNQDDLARIDKMENPIDGPCYKEQSSMCQIFTGHVNLIEEPQNTAKLYLKEGKPFSLIIFNAEGELLKNTRYDTYDAVVQDADFVMEQAARIKCGLEAPPSQGVTPMSIASGIMVLIGVVVLVAGFAILMIVLKRQNDLERVELLKQEMAKQAKEKKNEQNDVDMQEVQVEIADDVQDEKQPLNA